MAIHFEIVRTDAEQPWLTRIIAANGEEVWRTSENYVEERGAEEAIELLGKAFGQDVRLSGKPRPRGETPRPEPVVIRRVDERTSP